MLLHLVPFHCPATRGELKRLRQRLQKVYDLTVEPVSPWFDIEQSYDGRRGQYNALEILRQLLAGPDPRADRLLALTAADLFIPVLTHVFGEAQLDGPAAVVSSRRLNPEAYGLPRNERLLQRRLETEAVHEVGHTYGLLHCLALGCAMRGTTYVEEIDLKEPALCGQCRERLVT